MGSTQITRSQTIPIQSPHLSGDAPAGYAEASHARHLFWHNVMRQILMSLSVQCLNLQHGERKEGESPDPGAQLFDGRLAVLTQAGERIPIGAVHPVLACGINTSDEARSLSMAVECTVFQIRTPAGEVYTLPLHEMRAFHALTPELMAQLEAAAASAEGSEATDTGPFGFAAFTSLVSSKADRNNASS